MPASSAHLIAQYLGEPMTALNSTPRADGFRMPAEWESHSQTWMVWPERPDNWRLGGKPAQAAFTAVAKAIAEFEPVTIGVSAEQYENACARLDQANIRVVEITSDDAWVRDTGPTFVINDQGDVRGVDWTFNGWGASDWASWEADAKIAELILGELGVPRAGVQLAQTPRRTKSADEDYTRFVRPEYELGCDVGERRSREFWQRAEERNSNTANLYARLGLTQYAAMEAFVRWHY